MTNLDRPANVAGYAVGVAAGVYLGVVADGRFAGDPVEYRVVLPGDGAAATEALAARGWTVTAQPALGAGGPVTVLVVVVAAGRTAEVERDLDRLAPEGSAPAPGSGRRSAARAPARPGPRG